MDKNLFIYLTLQAGYTIPEMAKLLSLSTRELEDRLDRQSEFTIAEIKTWANTVGCSAPGFVFFPTYQTAAH